MFLSSNSKNVSEKLKEWDAITLPRKFQLCTGITNDTSFVPIDKVVSAFEILSEFSPREILPVTDCFENNYIVD